MNKMLVAVFDNENKAFEGLASLKDLHRKGDITLYATAVVNRDGKGRLHLDTAADEGPVGTATGLLAGSLIGLIGGPLGLAIGAVTGSVAGLIFDVSSDDINTTFVDEVSAALTNGKTAVIAEIDEEWTVPIDTTLAPLGGMLFRRLKNEVVEDQLARESEAMKTEYKLLKEELKEAKEEDKAAIEAAIAKLQHKAHATDELVKKKLNETKSQFDAKVKTMEKQMENARQKRKEKIQRRINELKEEYRLRNAKLKQASELISDAFSLKQGLKREDKATVL